MSADESSNDRRLSLLLSALMVLSMVAVGVTAFAGGAAAQQQTTPTEEVVVDADFPENNETAGEYTSIQAAIDAEGSNTLITVTAGTYNESIQIGGVSNVTIEGAGAGQSVINGMSGSDSAFTIGDNGGSPALAENISVSGFTINQNQSGTFTIDTTDTNADSNLTIEDNRIVANDSGVAAYLSGSNVLVADNNFTVEEGAEARELLATPLNPTVEKFTIEGNTFEGDLARPGQTGEGNAIELRGADSIVVDNDFNVASDGSAIYVTADDVTIQNNDLDGDYNLNDGRNSGVPAIETATALSNLHVTENQITNYYAGVQLYGAGSQATVTDARIADNTIENAYLGIGQGGDDGTQLVGNNISAQVQGVSGFNVDNMVVEDNTITVNNSTISDANQAGDPFIGNERGVDVSGDNVTVAGNDITSINTAVLVGSGATQDVVVTQNNLLGDEYGVDASSYTHTLNATANWWGSPFGPSAGSENAVQRDKQGVEVSDNVTFTPWLDAPTTDGGEPVAPVGNNDTGAVYGSISSAVTDAAAGETIVLGPVTFNESVTIDTENVTLKAANASTPPTIRYEGGENDGTPTVDVDASGVKIEDVNVIRVANDSREPKDAHAQGVLVQESHVRIEDTRIFGQGVNTTVGVDDYDRVDGLLVYDGGTPTNNVSIERVHVSGFYGGIVATVWDGQAVTDVTVEDSDIGYNVNGVVVKTHVEGVEPKYIGVGGSTIHNNSLAGAYVAGPTNAFNDSENYDYQGYDDIRAANGSLVEFAYNDFVNNNVGLASDGDGTVAALLNWWGSPDGPSVADGDGIAGSGNVAYDPFLTAPKDQVDALDENGDIETRQFASDLTLDEGVNAVAFPAPSERTLNETLDTSKIEAVYAFDNADGSWTQVTSANNPTPDALDVYVVVVEDGETAEAVMEFNNTRVNNPTPGSAEVSGGWNLVAPSQASDVDADEAFVTQNARVESTLGSPPYDVAGSQPLGTGDLAYSPYEGYWTFIDDQPGDSRIAAQTYNGITLEEFLVNVNLTEEDN